MRLFTFGCLLAAMAFGQDCDNLEKCHGLLQTNPRSSIAHFRLGEIYLSQHNYTAAANEFRSSLKGDQVPRWTGAWVHVNLGKIFDATKQRQRALGEYQIALRTRDNTRGALDAANKYIEAPYRGD